MAINDWFEFTSSAEREDRLRRFEKKVFPFGQEHRDWATKVLEENITSRISDNEKMYHYLNIKTIRLEESEVQREIQLDKWCKGFLKKTMKDEDLVFFFAMVDLDLKSNSFEELPSVEDIKALRDEYLVSLLPELKARGKRKFFFF